MICFGYGCDLRISSMSNLNYDSNDKLLDEIFKLSNKSDLLQKNFKQINLIINKAPELGHKAIDILIKCSNKKDIPDELINSIAIIINQLNSRYFI